MDHLSPDEHRILQRLLANKPDAGPEPKLYVAQNIDFAAYLVAASVLEFYDVVQLSSRRTAVRFRDPESQGAYLFERWQQGISKPVNSRIAFGARHYFLHQAVRGREQ